MKAILSTASHDLRWITLASLLAAGAWLGRGQTGAVLAPASGAAAPTNAQVYAVGKKVSDFPEAEDLSTPEAAYASIHRAEIKEGDAVWQRLSVRDLAEDMPRAPSEPLPADQAKRLLDAEVLEVHFSDPTNAYVFARMQWTQRKGIDIRHFGLENGRWLNSGNDVADTLEDARKLVARRCAFREAQRKLSSRPPIANPDAHLLPFVEFLIREAADPQAFLLKALATRRVVILGEVHHRPRYWAFNAALVKRPEFARHAGVIYLELPGNDQPLVDQFLASSKCDPQPVIEMLRDMLWVGWPDRPMLDFFKAVWEANQSLPKEKRVRIVLVDMARPWKEIKKREDWRKYDVERNQYMAENITRDLQEHAGDPRHALFIVGYGHAMVNLTQPGGDPEKSAGWHLRQTLGDTNVFAVFPHSPVISNNGQVYGRLALGLFEIAFAALTNRPMAFPLDHGPFGEQVFDADPGCLTTDLFRSGYHAYLYLGPLEDEIFSPLIPGFYTDEFVQELDRRYRIMEGKGLVESCGLARLDAASFERWMTSTWGQPRQSWRALGPLNAWHYGSEWEQPVREARHRQAMQDAPAIRREAQRLFDALRKADYQNPGDWQSFPAPDVDYTVHTDYPDWMRWVCQRFQTNPIVKVDLSEVFLDSNHLPALNYRLTLQDGSALADKLPFRYNARAERWGGWEGLDWHLGAAGQSEPAPAASNNNADPKQRLMALVEDFFRHNWRDLTARETIEWGEAATAKDGNSSIRYKYRARVWGKDSITNDQVFTFDPHGKFVSVKPVKNQ